MGKKEELLKNLGGNMNESIGIRKAVDGGTSTKPLKKNDKYAGRTRSRAAGEMEIERIIPDPEQPRTIFDKDDLRRMSENIGKVGILQPIRVRWSELHQKWMIISGERRYRASKLAGLETIPCVFVEGEMEETDLRSEQLVENCQREDLKPIEQAKAFNALIDLTDWSTQRLASELNLSKASVVRSLALLSLPSDIKDKIEKGDLTASAGYAISQVHGESQQRKLTDQVIEKKLSRDQITEITKSKKPATEERSQTSVRKITTKNATVIVQIDKANASTADVQSVLMAAMKELGKEGVKETAKKPVGSRAAKRKRTQ